MMKDQFTQNKDHKKEFEEQLKSIAEHTDASQPFRSELEQRLMSAHQARSVSINPVFRQTLPVLGWTIGLAALALFLNWVISSIAPTPSVPASDITTPTTTPIPTVEPTHIMNAVPETSTPTGSGGHDWRGTKLYLVQQLPQSPVEANVYLKKYTEQATHEDVLALAQQFGINGEIQEGPSDIPGQTSYTIDDGRERLAIRADHYFMYHSNFGAELYLDNLSEERARIIANDFLKKHGFNFEYKFEHAMNEHSQKMQGTHFYILPLTPGGYEMRSDYMQTLRYEIWLDNTGENIIFTGYPIEFESVGLFGIITVEDALQKILDPNPQSGLMENSRGQGGGSGGSSFYQLNVSGTPVPFPTSLPKPGQGNFEYIVQEGDTLLGIAQSYGITPEKIVQANGLSDGGILNPGMILIIPSVQPEQLRVGQRLEGERGIFQVNIFEESQRVWYGFFSTASDKNDWPYMILEGDDLNSLHQYNNLPVYIWGTIDRFDQNGRPVVKIEQYEIPFPHLEFQIIQGKQKIMAIQGRQVLTFTASNGTTYVQIGISDSHPLDEALLFGDEGDDLIAEVLIVPDETFNGFPVMRIYSLTYAIDPIAGQPNELSITANQFNTYSEPNAQKDYALPTATIEKVDLVYYVRNPTLALADPNAGPQYLQPAWRFYGHYSNGDEFEILVQALKEEFLLPELAPYTPPG